MGAVPPSLSVKWNTFLQCAKQQATLLWRTYIKVHGFKMIAALFMKITADLLGFIGPLALAPIIDYVTDIVYLSTNCTVSYPIVSIDFDNILQCFTSIIR